MDGSVHNVEGNGGNNNNTIILMINKLKDIWKVLVRDVRLKREAHIKGTRVRYLDKQYKAFQFNYMST